MNAARLMELCLERILFHIASISIRHHRWRHPGGTVYRIVTTPDEFREYVDVSVRVSVCHVFVHLIANHAMPTFYYSVFHITVSLEIECLPLLGCPGMICSETLCPYQLAPRSVVYLEASNIL